MPRTVPTTPVVEPRREAPQADAFFDAFADANPFTSNRVTEPSRYDVDVPLIHQKSYDRLVGLAGTALSDAQAAGSDSRPGGIGAVLLGGAGIGKSHLLSRLYRWARGTERARKRACYVYLHNILADPERLPRYLLKCVVSLLAEGGRGVLYESPLYRLIDGAIRQARGPANTAASFSFRDGGEAYASTLANRVKFPQAHDLLLQFWRHARPEKVNDPARRFLAQQAVSWLSGEEIDDEPARLLGLKVDGQGSVMLKDDHEIEQVLLILARLAQANDEPFVLCVDQVDNLDPDKVKSLVRFLHALLDHGKNLLVIISGIKQTLLAYRDDGTIPEAAWDRIAEYKVELARISRTEARYILEARLERFLEPFRSLEPVHRHVLEDHLFPLGQAWLEQRLGDGIEFRPRDVLIWARDAWEDEQARLAATTGARWLEQWPSKPAPDVTPPEPQPKPSQVEIEAEIDRTVERKIEEQVAQRRLHSGSLPPDAGNLAGLTELILAQCEGDGRPYSFRGVERMKKKAGRLPPYDLKVREQREDGQEVVTGVLFITNIGLSATTALRRLLEDDQPPDHRILVTDHERRPLKVGAQGVEYYRDLEKLGPDKFEHLKLGFDQYAQLDALEGAVNMARVGDLEIEVPRGVSRPVAESEVVASHHRRGRYLDHPLLRPLLTEERSVAVGPPPSRAQLDEDDVRRYVMAQLAWMMGTTTHALAKGYVQIMPVPRTTLEAAWPQVKAIAERMHGEELIHAQPLDDDLFLLLRK